MSSTPRRIAIFRMGHLGDTVIAMPALWTVRRSFPKAEIYYLTQASASNKVAASQVLQTGSVYDRELVYRTDSKFDLLKTVLRFRLLGIDTLVYIPPFRTPAQLDRDERFFRLAGVRRFIGLANYREVDRRPRSSPLPTLVPEADILLEHLAKDGVHPNESPHSLMHLGVTEDERSEAATWLQSHGIDSATPIVGVGPGSKMSSKLWGADRFHQVLSDLNARFKPAFVAFGSADEAETCAATLPANALTVNAAGRLSVRQSAALFERIGMYVGNDTGTMHLAAAGGARCVAIFSARDWPGRWYPYGPGHTVFREWVPCEGCLLEVCDKQNLCLTKIDPERVSKAALALFAELHPPPLD